LTGLTAEQGGKVVKKTPEEWQDGSLIVLFKGSINGLRKTIGTKVREPKRNGSADTEARKSQNGKKL